MDTLVASNLAFVLIAALLVLLGFALLWWWRGRRDKEAGEIDRIFREISAERLTDVVITDGDEGEIHLDHVLLTTRGIVVLHFKRVQGTVFGSDRMDDWTVIHGKRRHTFANPQGALYDRVAAVKRIVREVPVEGAILFGSGAHFSGGMPRHVATLQQFRERYRPPQRDTIGKSIEAFYPHWERLRDAVIDANLERMKRL